MNVERASIADTDALVEMRLAYLTEDNGHLEEDVVEAIRKGLPGYYEAHLDRDLYVYVVRDGKAIVSCAFLIVIAKPLSPAFISGKTGIVLNVYTCPEYRRKGYAAAIMRELLVDAQAMDVSPIELKATDDGYPLYRSVGFVDNQSKYHDMKWVKQ